MLLPIKPFMGTGEFLVMVRQSASLHFPMENAIRFDQRVRVTTIEA